MFIETKLTVLDSMVIAPGLEAVRRQPVSCRQPSASVEEVMGWIEVAIPLQVLFCKMFLYPGFAYTGTLAPFSKDRAGELERISRMFGEVACLEHKGRVEAYEVAQPFSNTVSAWRQCVKERRIDPVLVHFAYGAPVREASYPDEHTQVFRYVPDKVLCKAWGEEGISPALPYFHFLLSPQSRFLSSSGIDCPNWTLEQLEADTWFQVFSGMVKETFVFIMPDATLPYAIQQIEWNTL